MRLSPLLLKIYNDDFQAFRSQVAKSENDTRPIGLFEALWSVQRTRRKILADVLEREYIELQQFIPAGRSFFTTTGKAISAFEQANMLEPFTTTFGRHLSAVRETISSRRIFRRTASPEMRQDVDSLMKTFLEPIMGGEIVMERNKEFVRTLDGRIIIFQHLSSGQQEVLPLVLSVLHYIENTSTVNSILYIEEPEAHLFPATQDAIVMLLARIVPSSLYRASMMITTHSPYVLAKVNNLLKAGSIGNSSDARQARRVDSIIDATYWLSPENVVAYAIKEGYVESIIDKSGLIDGDYLDSMSETMSEEFESLLEAELAS